MEEKKIFTIGHSTRAADDFISMLRSFEIQLLADIRSFPGSKRYPHFNRETLAEELRKNQIAYKHFRDLGGRRKADPNSQNTAWRNESFRGYADYMATENFQSAAAQLEDLARNQRVAMMCSEAVWWRCHRSLVADFLKHRGWLVLHIMDIEKSEEHPYTAPAKIVNGELSYTK